MGLSKQKRCKKHGRKAESETRLGYYWCRQCQAALNAKNAKKDEVPPSATLTELTTRAKHKSTKLTNEELFQQTLIEQVKLCSHPSPRIKLAAIAQVQTLLAKMGIGGAGTGDDEVERVAKLTAVLESKNDDPLFCGKVCIVMVESRQWILPVGIQMLRDGVPIGGAPGAAELVESDPPPLQLEEPAKSEHIIDAEIVPEREPCACECPYDRHSSGGACAGPEGGFRTCGCQLYTPISESRRM